MCLRDGCFLLKDCFIIFYIIINCAVPAEDTSASDTADVHQNLPVNLQVRSKEPSLCASLPTWLHTILCHEWLETAIEPALPGRRLESDQG